MQSRYLRLIFSPKSPNCPMSPDHIRMCHHQVGRYLCHTSHTRTQEKPGSLVAWEKKKSPCATTGGAYILPRLAETRSLTRSPTCSPHYQHHVHSPSIQSTIQIHPCTLDSLAHCCESFMRAVTEQPNFLRQFRDIGTVCLSQAHLLTSALPRIISSCLLFQ
ncbi:hypothetical protein BGZ63DRAFT_109297 [Mariannaea sp. PMI_226]|nr:hypothetical protein BGZ63DRAFT_109297 [Mariannaea sp. PMI_226]